MTAWQVDGELEIHPLSQRLPDMSDQEYAWLKRSIKTQGLLNPIVIYEGKILDGRHRLRACRETGAEPRFAPYVDDQPVSFILASNIARRELSIPQRLELIDQFRQDLAAEARKRKIAGTSAAADAKGKTSELAAKIAGVSSTTVERDRSTKKTIEKLEAKGMANGAARVRAAAAKSVRAGARAAALAEMELRDHGKALHRLRSFLTSDQIEALEDGRVDLTAEDLVVWSQANAAESPKIAALVFGHRWNVRRAMKFLRKEITAQTTIEELSHRCVSGNGLFETLFSTFRIVVTLEPQAPGGAQQ